MSKNTADIPALSLRSISKSYDSHPVLTGLSMDFFSGTAYCLMAPSGSGKTTLMNMLSGIYFPDEGEIYVDGKEVTIASPKDSFALGIGMIHQHFKLVDVLTAAENIILGLPGKEVLKMDDYIKGISERSKIHSLLSILEED